MSDIHIEREWAFPSRWTFEIGPIKELIESEMSDGLWIDPFAGKHSPADVTNDLNPEMNADYTLEATEFLKMFDDSEVDGGILLDPPYNATQVKRLYDDIGRDIRQNDTNSAFYARPRDEASRILSTGAKAISFGWNSNGLSESRGFYKKRILLVAHGSARNDTICVVEVKENDVMYEDPDIENASEVSW